eukprot:TRINITY_DN13335_c0_g1_i1.p1 TRINITY_DN13335_c0_g1~~TRINITY_DN13335_c0_g1_i1.p1  ORF type:complete len:480 (+),score=77.31 TRINITY_DN13335_c0_g1_i1:172-1611(+)
MENIVEEKDAPAREGEPRLPEPPYLPLEILMHVFSFLDDVDDIVLGCAPVSRDWRDASLLSNLPQVTLGSRFFTEEHRFHSVMQRWRVRSLVLKHGTRAPLGESFGRSCSSLRSLDLSSSRLNPQCSCFLAIETATAGTATGTGPATTTPTTADTAADDTTGANINSADLHTCTPPPPRTPPSLHPSPHPHSLCGWGALSLCTQLEYLNLSKTSLDSIHWVSGCPDLKHLNLNATQLPSEAEFRARSPLHGDAGPYATVLEPLRSCRKLKMLVLSNTCIDDTTALSSCAELSHVSFGWCSQLRNVTSLSSCRRLERVNLAHTQVEDISALGFCTSLVTLVVTRTGVSDISCLSACSQIEKLYMHSTSVSDLSVCANFAGALKVLDATDCRNVTDIVPLYGCKKLRTLSLCGTQVVDLGPLELCESLEVLLLNHSRVSDLDALKSLNIQQLNITGTPAATTTTTTTAAAAAAAGGGVLLA